MHYTHLAYGVIALANGLHAFYSNHMVFSDSTQCKFCERLWVISTNGWLFHFEKLVASDP